MSSVISAIKGAISKGAKTMKRAVKTMKQTNEVQPKTDLEMRMQMFAEIHVARETATAYPDGAECPVADCITCRFRAFASMSDEEFGKAWRNHDFDSVSMFLGVHEMHCRMDEAKAKGDVRRYAALKWFSTGGSAAWGVEGAPHYLSQQQLDELFATYPQEVAV
jgi:hypothetical protein